MWSSSLINCYHLSNIIQDANNVFSTFHSFKHLRKKSRPTSPSVRHYYHLEEKPDVGNHAKEVEGAQHNVFLYLYVLRWQRVCKLSKSVNVHGDKVGGKLVLGDVQERAVVRVVDIHLYLIQFIKTSTFSIF